jgi:hypothetical protein
MATWQFSRSRDRIKYATDAASDHRRPLKSARDRGNEGCSSLVQ